MAKIISPVKGYNEKVVGVTFTDSVAETNDENLIRYFREAGYTVEGKAARNSQKSSAPSALDVAKAEAGALGLPKNGSLAQITERIAAHKAKLAEQAVDTDNTGDDGDGNDDKSGDAGDATGDDGKDDGGAE